MSKTASYAVNGRFLKQTATGVQRYAINVVQSMNEALAAADKTAILLAPPRTPDPNLSQLTFTEIGYASGHIWEQLSLPSAWSGRLLNLCNTAPALKTDQVVCIHDANVFAAPDSYSRSFRMFYRTLQPLLARRAVRVATVSHAAARQIARHLPINVADIAVLPNGHEHALLWDPRRAEIAPSFLAKSNGRPFVLTLGSQARHKNLAVLMAAAPELDDAGIDIIVAGGGAGIFAERSISRHSNVKLIGRVSDHDLAYLLDEALCLGFPSLTEGFGLPIVEAMARGCPVISSDCASMPEVCGHAALMASPSDPSAWVRHARALNQSPDLRSELSGRGREQVHTFSWSSTAAGYIDLLERPLSRRQTYRAYPAAVPATTVVVATRGRPDIVAKTVRYLLSTQTLKPETVIVSCVEVADAGSLTQEAGVTVITGPAGLAAQRNSALTNLPASSEVVAFFDDDFIAEKDWLAVAATTFRDESLLVGFTGRVIADGINGPGIAFDVGVRLVEAKEASSWSWIEPYSPYGCNMAFRVSAIGDTRFDERLVLYGWLEDRDFAASLAKKGGRFAKCADAIGVHMGTKMGRVSGKRLGYSQIANPLYMLPKGTISVATAVNHVGANTASNFVKAFKQEPFVDRRGRALGNLIAIFDLLCGRLRPENAAVIPVGAKVVPRGEEVKSR
jgi:glycosyltransferase involved in cell wall biosynthesis